MTTELALLSQVSYRGRSITGERLRGLLALLAGDLRSGASTMRLVEGLWPDELPENPTKALQVLVSRARSLLGSDVIVTTQTGYRLSLSEEQVDSSAIVLSASASARLSRAGDHVAALAHAEAGLALWDGTVGGDAVLDDPVAALRNERASTYRSLVRARALALSRLGRRAEALEPLTALVRERPRDEELLLELLQCEAATAGPSAALARYEAYRSSLRDELGTDPGAPLQAVYQELLQGTTPVVRHGVPHEPNELLGRDGDIRNVASLLHSSRVTSIVGPGGLGKTRLAHAVSRQAEERVVEFVALAGVSIDADIVSEVASAVGAGEVRLTPVSQVAIPTDALAAIGNALGPGPALLVLDNCEHVIDAAAELVQGLVSMTKDLRVLTTSRAPLGLSSESVYLLPELTLPTTVELFNQRARAARRDVDLSADVVEELCRHLDGLPLATELAAARVRIMSVAEIASRLKDRFALLRGGARDAPERHRTLQAVVDWSWNLLDSAGQSAMQSLSIFPGGFTSDGAERLVDSQGDVVQVLEELVDQSLLKVADTPSGTRFSMLETVREFCTARRDEAGETDQVLDGFLAWARDFGQSHHDSAFGPDPRAATERIRVEQDNLILALRHGVTRTDGATVAATSAALAALWLVESNFARLATLADEPDWVLSHFRPDPVYVEATRTASVVSAGSTLMLQSPRAMRSLVTLRRLPPAPPTTLIRGMAVVLANPEVFGIDHAVLQVLCDSDESMVAGFANGLATYVWERENDLDRAQKAAQNMVDVYDRHETPWMWTMAVSRVGELSLLIEQPADAHRYFLQALEAQEELGDHVDRVGIRGALAQASLHLGDVDEAEHWLELATQNQADDDVGMLAYAIGVRAEIATVRGEVEAGLRLWLQAYELLRNAASPVMGGDPSMDPWFLEVQAVVVAAHAHGGRLAPVQEIIRDLPQRALMLLAEPPASQPGYVMELGVSGAILLALAMVDLDRGQTRSGARTIALAERLRYHRNFQPTMSSARAREAAEHADRSAYDDAVLSYADLDLDQLRAVALTALRERA